MVLTLNLAQARPQQVAQHLCQHNCGYSKAPKKAPAKAGAGILRILSLIFCLLAIVFCLLEIGDQLEPQFDGVGWSREFFSIKKGSFKQYTVMFGKLGGQRRINF